MLFSHRGASYHTSTAANKAVVEEDVVIIKPLRKTEENGAVQNLMGGSISKY